MTAEAIEELKSYPALFAYEGEEKDVRVGYLRRIKERARSVLIEYDFEPNIPAIPFSKIEPIKGRLDIENWEMNRTHWAVKDVNGRTKFWRDLQVVDKVGVPDGI